MPVRYNLILAMVMQYIRKCFSTEPDTRRFFIYPHPETCEIISEEIYFGGKKGKVEDIVVKLPMKFAELSQKIPNYLLRII